MRACLRRLASAASLGALVSSAATANPSPPAPAPEPLHWSAQLGNRVAAVENAFPILDRVVLVPDTATYLDELSRWSPAGRWPVLFDDARLAPMFVRAFKPAQLVRRAPADSSASAAVATPAALRDACDRVVRRAWSAPSLGADATVRDAFAAAKYVPTGIVFASTADPAWTAAVALAAARGEPIAWLEGNFGAPNDCLGVEQSHSLQDAVTRALDDSGLAWRSLGDAIDTITICRAIGNRAPIEASMAIPSPKPEDRKGNVATTDLLGRSANGARGAFCGWIFGDSATAAAAAMSSLFLPRRDAVLFSGYEGSPPWSSYAIAPADEILRRDGWHTTVRDGAAASAVGWRSMLAGGWPFDLVLINSSGSADFLNAFALQRIGVGDVPVLDRPAAAHVIHSWSLYAPASLGTIAGRFLDHGAYAYIGAVEEPYIAAFVPPGEVASRLATGSPLLVAARHWDGPGALLWRVGTIGDPLMLCPPREKDPRRRIAAPAAARDAGYGAPLHDAVKDLMRRAASEQDAAAAAAAMRIIDMLGDDRVASGFLAAARAGGWASGAVCQAALPALFRLGDASGFASAWLESKPTDTLLLDMLWQLVPAHASEVGSSELLRALEPALRPDTLVDDAATLYRLVRETRGPEAAMGYLARAVERMPDEAARKRLRDAVKSS
ncbi:MAG: hypothetical protein U0575_02290 [Phycisphaerales bacterium]